MQFTKKINVSKYLIGTILNLIISLKIIGIDNYKILLIFFLGVIFNHLFLILGVINMFNTQAKKRAALYFLGKFVVIVLIMVYAMQNLPKNIILLTIIYIIQLIILVLSIKRNTNKN